MERRPFFKDEVMNQAVCVSETDQNAVNSEIRWLSARKNVIATLLPCPREHSLRNQKLCRGLAVTETSRRESLSIQLMVDKKKR